MRWLVGVLIVLAVLWCGYWYAASRVAAMGIARVTAAVAARGNEAGCGTQAIAGFPLTLDVQCAGARFAGSDMSADLGQIGLVAPLYYPGHVEANLTAPLTFNAPAPGLAVTASWQTARATADVGLNGLSGASLQLAALSLQQSGDSLRLPFRNVSAEAAELVATPGTGDDYRVTGSARDLVIEPANGQKLPVLAGAVDLSALKFGRTLGTDIKQTLRSWIANGGGIDLTRLTLFLGAASVSASGPLTLSSAGLLSGTLTVRIVGMDQLPDIMEGIKPGTHDRVAQLVGAVSAFTRPVKTEEGEARETVLNIRDGAVRVGIIPVGRIPPLKL
ncbi:MAG: DUF2125 domain-containing protein [Rhizobiales bacterium]|nr:DUF2125 domain-containing protein [Hyphomicrobiales bacterium]MBN9009883.1 DUF2125 domain-containing protein [Hyphomicrobiales bacterium]